MQATANAVGAGMPSQRLEFKYDFMNRRVQKTILSWSGTAWAVSSARRYLYDGWSLIGEFDAPSGTSIGSLVRSYTWGLDIARSLTDAGGVGALLQIRDYGLSKDYFPAYDGNGNIVALFDSSDGGVAAAYEYSPYGETLRCEGTYSKENSFRFSTKMTDDETGLVYYGRRYYSPSQGRFLGRDSIEEEGGLNLYGFCGNDGINAWDRLGEFVIDPNRTTNPEAAFFSSVGETLGYGPVGQGHMDGWEQFWDDSGQHWVRTPDGITYKVIENIIFHGSNTSVDYSLTKNDVQFSSVVTSGGAILGYVTNTGMTNIGVDVILNQMVYYYPEQYFRSNQITGSRIALADILGLDLSRNITTPGAEGGYIVSDFATGRVIDYRPSPGLQDMTPLAFGVASLFASSGVAANSAPAIGDILMPGGRALGQTGSKAVIREMQGGLNEAQSLFKQLSHGGTVVPKPGYPGTWVELPNGGGGVGLRTTATRSPGTAATIDVNIPSIPGVTKIKFNP